MFLYFRGIFLSVRLADMLFGHTNYCFSSYFASRCATSSCSCVQLPGTVVIFGRVEQRASILSKCYYGFFVLPPLRLAPLSPHYCFPLVVFRTFALFACMVIWNAPRVLKRCRPPFVVIFLFTLGSWTIPCVMLFEVFVFVNSSYCNLLSLTVKFCFSMVSLYEGQRFS